MDKGMDRIAQDVKDIVETRAAIADKLEKLEHRFSSTVEDVKMMAEDFTDRTQSIIEDTVNSVKNATEPSRLIAQHPWVMVSGAIVAGFAVGRLLRQEGNGVLPYYPPGSHAADVMPSSGKEYKERDGVYPFYTHASHDASTRPVSSSKTPIFTTFGPILADTLGPLAGELVELGKSALRTWLKEMVQGGGARSPRKAKPYSDVASTEAFQGSSDQRRPQASESIHA